MTAGHATRRHLRAAIHDAYEQRDEYEYREGSLKDGYALASAGAAAIVKATIAPRRHAHRAGRSSAACVTRMGRSVADRSRGSVGSLKARRVQSGRLFVLDIDKCTGEIVHARPQFLRTFGAYEPRALGRSPPLLVRHEAEKAEDGRGVV